MHKVDSNDKKIKSLIILPTTENAKLVGLTSYWARRTVVA